MKDVEILPSLVLLSFLLLNLVFSFVCIKSVDIEARYYPLFKKIIRRESERDEIIAAFSC
jgi:hypothetical protein